MIDRSTQSTARNDLAIFVVWSAFKLDLANAQDDFVNIEVIANERAWNADWFTQERRFDVTHLETKLHQADTWVQQ